MDCRAHLCSLEASGEKLCVFGSPRHCALVDVATRVSCSARFPFAVSYIFLNPILKFASKSISTVILDFFFIKACLLRFNSGRNRIFAEKFWPIITLFNSSWKICGNFFPTGPRHFFQVCCSVLLLHRPTYVSTLLWTEAETHPLLRWVILGNICYVVWFMRTGGDLSFLQIVWKFSCCSHPACLDDPSKCSAACIARALFANHTLCNALFPW